MKKNGKTDRRVAKTKRAIYKAVAELLSEKDINEVTVKDIAELADINRKTFYNHYSDVQQLLEEIENDIAEKFTELLDATDFLQAIHEPATLFDQIYVIISKDLDLNGVLFKMQKNVRLVNKLIDIVSATASQYLDKDPVKVGLVVRYIFAGEMAVYQEWFNSNRDLPMPELSDTLNRLSISGINGLLGGSLPEQGA